MRSPFIDFLTKYRLMEEAFSTLNRLALGPTAPPQGLELTKVDYPPEAFVHPEQLRWHTGNA